MLQPDNGNARLGGRMRRSIGVLLAVLMVAGCDAPPAPDAERETPPPSDPVIDERPPVAADSGEASLSLDDRGRPVLTWIEPGAGGKPQLRFSIREASGWTPATTVAAGGDWFVNWADFPSLGRNGSLWVTHWLAKSGSSPYAYAVMVSASTDAGASWSAPMVAHGDDSPTEHGFVSYYPEPEGGVGMVWLDGRETARDGPMTLRTARVTGEPGLADEQLLDERVCDCCQTDAALTADGPVVVYRDRTEDEVRDIVVVRRIAGRWTSPALVAEDDWLISACPVNGPAVAARDRAVAVAWFSGAQGPQVKLALSSDSGASFSEPMLVDARAPLGRVDATWMPDGRLAMSFMDREGAEAVIRVGILQQDGTLQFSDIGRTASARSSGFPRLAANDAGLWVAWRQVDEAGAKVRVSRVPVRTPGGS